MKKILYIASTFGHIKSFHLPYIEELAKLGYEVHVAALGVEQSQFNNQNIKVINIPFRKSMLSPKNLQCVALMAKLVKKEHYREISVHTSLAAFFVRLAVKVIRLPREEKPVVINTVHGYLFDERTEPVKRNILLLAEKLVRSVSNVIVVMNAQDYEIAEMHKLYRDKLVKINGLGIDSVRFSRQQVEAGLSQQEEEGTAGLQETAIGIRSRERGRAKLSEGEIVLIYAAEFSKRKNQKMLISAMGALPRNVKLLLAGTGEELEACKKLTEGDERIVFLGHVKNLEYYYYLADICVSSSRSEGLPFNIMEAMAMGLPVVATRVKGHEDLIEQDVNGYLFDFDDEEEFTRRIRELCGDACKRVNMGENNEKRAQLFSINAVREDFMRILTVV